MENKGKNTESLDIQKLLGNYLQLRVSSNGLTAEGHHLEEDSLSAFVEGSMSEREVQPIVSHLVDCSFCRHVTAELVKLDFAFAGEISPVAIETKAPITISKVLSGVLSRILGNNDGVVFAHQELDENAEKTTSEDEKSEEKEDDK